MKAYPDERAGIYKAKAVREAIDARMADMHVPMLDEDWQERGAIADILPELARILAQVWQDITAEAPSFDMHTFIERAIMKGEVTHVEAMDDEAVPVFVNHAFARALMLLREKNPHLVPASWNQGVCPFCGAHPRVAFDTPTGRTLFCPLCAHAWSFDRERCPVCDATDPTSRGYWEAEGLDGMRVYFCRTCKHYLKVIDTQARQVFDAETEDALSLELDSLALKEGFSEAPQ